MPRFSKKRTSRARRTLNRRVNHLSKISRPEVKHQQDESGAFDTVGATQGTVIKPQQLQQGFSRNTRVGDKVKSRNIRFQALLKLGDTTNPSSAVRILALRSKKQNPDTGTLDTGDFPNWYSTVDEDKFFVLKDILTNVSALSTDPGVSVVNGSQTKKIKFNLRTGYRKMQYDGASNQSPLNNEIVIFMIAENSGAEVAYNWQHYYLDN